MVVLFLEAYSQAASWSAKPLVRARLKKALNKPQPIDVGEFVYHGRVS